MRLKNMILKKEKQKFEDQQKQKDKIAKQLLLIDRQKIKLEEQRLKAESQKLRDQEEKKQREIDEAEKSSADIIDVLPEHNDEENLLEKLGIEGPGAIPLDQRPQAE